MIRPLLILLAMLLLTATVQVVPFKIQMDYGPAVVFTGVMAGYVIMWIAFLRWGNG